MLIFCNFGSLNSSPNTKGCLRAEVIQVNRSTRTQKLAFIYREPTIHIILNHHTRPKQSYTFDSLCDSPNRTIYSKNQII